MKRNELISKFSKLGFFLQPDLLNFLLENPEKIERVVEEIKKRKITQKFLSLNLFPSLQTKEIRVKVIKKLEKKEKVSVDNLVEMLSSRYKKLQKFLIKRMELTNLLSINKISPRSKKFSIIGLVREIDEELNSITLEDLTGEINLKVENVSDLVEDEVIGVVCERRGDDIFAIKILHPDIPTYREIGKSKEEIKILISSFLPKKIETISFDILWILKYKDQIKVKPENLKFFCFDENVTDPSLIEINGVKFFISSGKFLKEYEKKFNLPKLKTLLKMLKKRHLNPKISEENLNEIFLLDVLPDVIVVKGEKTDFLNYKGITLICCGEKGVLINLKTRDVLKIDV